MVATTLDDVYDDPDNILAGDDDTVDGAVELPDDEADEVSQSIFLPEKDDDDERGDLEMTDPMADGAAVAAAQDYADDADPDAAKLSDMDPADEDDGTES